MYHNDVKNTVIYMSEVTKETLRWAFKPFDIVTNKRGCVGFIQEVSVNSCQDTPDEQISYAVKWLVGDEMKCAWFHHNELERHCNLFVEIAKATCHPFGSNFYQVQSLFNNFDGDI